MEDREEQLRAEALKLEEKILAQGLLGPGERIDISIVISKVPTSEIAIRLPYDGKRARQTDEPVTEEDWGNIMRLTWNPRQKKVLETLREKNNAPASTVELNLGGSSMGILNSVLRSAGLSLRLAAQRPGGQWADRKIKVFRTTF